MKNQILVLEDSKIDFKILKKAFDKNNFEGELIFHQNAEEARKYLDDCLGNGGPALPHIILSDLNLCGTSGLDFLESIRAEPKFGPIPIIVVSNSDNPSDVKEAYSRGASAYLLKKVDFDEFTRDISTLISFWLGDMILVPHLNH